MLIRKATYADLAAIRLLRLQLTNRPSSGILHKHWRVLVLEARTDLFICEHNGKAEAFMALRKCHTDEYCAGYLGIVHLSLRSLGSEKLVAQQLARQAELTAMQQHCAGLVVELIGLSREVVAYYTSIGFTLCEDRLVRPLNR